ncbi:MAG: PxKF domain-containing protein [Verrucomicrobia bacterium]|nr:PxKF domain-containing protein [Verrucomicrobiota bacterium]
MKTISKVLFALSLISCSTVSQAAVVDPDGGNLVVSAGLGEVNNVTIALADDTYTIRDTGALLGPSAGDGFVVISPNEVQIAAAGVGRITVFLGDQGDRVEIATSVALYCQLAGEDGDDTLLGGNAGNQLHGGPGNDFLRGGAAYEGLDVGADADMVLTDTTLTVLSTGEVDTFEGIEIIVLHGGPSDNVLDASAVTAGSRLYVVLYGEEGDDRLTGGHGSDFISGGEGNDFIYLPGEGDDTIDGGPGDADEIREDRDADMVLTDTNLIIGPETDTFTNIERFTLVGGASDNRLDATQTTGTTGLANIHLLGADGDDTLLAGSVVFYRLVGGFGSDFIDGGASPFSTLREERDADMVLTDTTLTIAAEVDTFVNIDSIGLLGGTGNNVLDASQVTPVSGFLSLLLFGADGDDTLAGGSSEFEILQGGLGNDRYAFRDGWALDHIQDPDGSGVLDFSSLSVPLTFIPDIYGVTLYATDGLDQALVNGGSGDWSILDGAASDSLYGKDRANTWKITGNNAGTVSGLGFSNIENLTGRTSDDLFVFANGAGVSGQIDGGIGSDTLDWSQFIAPPTVNTTGAGTLDGSRGTASNLGGGFDNIESLLGVMPPFVFDGFLPPIGGADATGGSFADPLQTLKLGSTIPVKFSITSSGVRVVMGTHTLQAIKWSSQTNPDPPIDATPTDAATTGNQFRLTGNEWHFNLDTQATGLSAGIWQLIATLSDSSQHSVWIQIK